MKFVQASGMVWSNIALYAGVSENYVELCKVPQNWFIVTAKVRIQRDKEAAGSKLWKQNSKMGWA